MERERRPSHQRRAAQWKPLTRWRGPWNIRHERAHHHHKKREDRPSASRSLRPLGYLSRPQISRTKIPGANVGDDERSEEKHSQSIVDGDQIRIRKRQRDDHSPKERRDDSRTERQQRGPAIATLH